MPDLEIRAWLTPSIDTFYLANQRPRLKINDIVLQIDPRSRTITLISGFQDRRLNLQHEFSPPVSYAEIVNFIPRPQINEVHLLSSNEWLHVRSSLIAHDQDAHWIIEQLENLQQQKLPQLDGVGATIYDVLTAPLRIFQPVGRLKRAVQDTITDWRISLASGRSDNSPDLYIALKAQGLADDSAPLADMDPFHREMADLFENRFREEDSIHYDFNHPGPDLQRMSNLNTPRLDTQMCFIKDRKSDRMLMLYMAHRKGTRQSDLLNADLIYESSSQKSIVFVQYKRLNKDKCLTLSGSQQRMQLERLLNLCAGSHEGCVHRNRSSREFCSSDEMRLRDCPVFYKLLDHKPKIQSGGQSTEGLYLTACLLCQLSVENGGRVCREPHLGRALSTNTFFDLIRSGQIGSRASEFETYRQLMKEHMTSDIFAEPEEDKVVVYAAELNLRAN